MVSPSPYLSAIVFVSRLARGARGFIRIPLCSCWLCLVVGLASLHPTLAYQPQRPAAAPDQYVPGRLLIVARPGADLEPFHRQHGNRVLKRLPDLDLEVVEACPAIDACEMAEKYQRCSDVESVEPDYLVQADMAPNDPGYVNGLLWALHNSGQSGGVAGADMEAAAAWNGVRSAPAPIFIRPGGIRTPPTCP
jgi:hypothetical protein